MSFSTVSLSEIARPAIRPIAVVPGTSYRTIGVKWWGEGAYERETIDGTQTAAKTLSIVRENDLIINKIWVRHGSTAIASKAVDGCAASGEFPTFEIDNSRVLPQWIHWLTKSQDFWQKCDNLSRGTSGKNRIRPELFLTIDIPLPPLEEQQRIVGRIEKIVAKVEEERCLRKEIEREKEALLKAAMYFAFGTIGNSQIVLLEDVCAKIIDNLHSNPIYSDEGIPCIRSTDVGWGELFLDRVLKTSEEEYNHRTIRGAPIKDDIILVREGSIGKAAIVKENQRFSLGQRVMLLRPNQNRILPKFFLYQLLSPFVYEEQMLSLYTGTTSFHLNIGALKKFTIRLPSLEEQQRIIAYLDSLQSKVDMLKRIQAEAAAKRDVLLPSILDKAFKGEL